MRHDLDLFRFDFEALPKLADLLLELGVQIFQLGEHRFHRLLGNIDIATLF